MTKRIRTTTIKRPKAEKAANAPRGAGGGGAVEGMTQDQKLEEMVGKAADMLRMQGNSLLDPEVEGAGVAISVFFANQKLHFGVSNANLDDLRNVVIALGKHIRRTELESELAELNGL